MEHRAATDYLVTAPSRWLNTAAAIRTKRSLQLGTRVEVWDIFFISYKEILPYLIPRTGPQQSLWKKFRMPLDCTKTKSPFPPSLTPQHEPQTYQSNPTPTPIPTTTPNNPPTHPIILRRTLPGLRWLRRHLSHPSPSEATLAVTQAEPAGQTPPCGNPPSRAYPRDSSHRSRRRRRHTRPRSRSGYGPSTARRLGHSRRRWWARVGSGGLGGSRFPSGPVGRERQKL
jgi:hypothetical protein